MPSAGFEPTILVSERPQIHALDRVTTGIGTQKSFISLKYIKVYLLVRILLCAHVFIGLKFISIPYYIILKTRAFKIK
jgi:hypothetical protein